MDDLTSEPTFGPAVAVFRLGWQRNTDSNAQIVAAVDDHVGGLVREYRAGRFRRSGNASAVHLLADPRNPAAPEPRLLLVSSDGGWSGHDQDAVDAVGEVAIVTDVGRYVVIDEAATPGGPDGATRVLALRPQPGHTGADIVTVIAGFLPRVGTVSRGGVLGPVRLLRNRRDDGEHILLIGVEPGGVPRADGVVRTVAEVAEVTEWGLHTALPVPSVATLT